MGTKVYVYYKRKRLANSSHTLSILLSSLEVQSCPSITALRTWHIGLNITKWLFPRKMYCLLPKTQVLACFIVTSHIFSDIPTPKICLQNNKKRKKKVFLIIWKQEDIFYLGFLFEMNLKWKMEITYPSKWLRVHNRQL